MQIIDPLWMQFFSSFSIHTLYVSVFFFSFAFISAFVLYHFQPSYQREMRALNEIILLNMYSSDRWADCDETVRGSNAVKVDIIIKTQNLLRCYTFMNAVQLNFVYICVIWFPFINFVMITITLSPVCILI